MKLLILSDSHGAFAPMEEAVRREQPDQIIHLGDLWRDAKALEAVFPHLPVEMVPGNCDAMFSAPQEKLLKIEGHMLLIGHGHTWRVKQSLLAAAYAAEEQGAEVLLFGHTHQPYCGKRGTALLFNPGSIRNGDYGVLSLTEDGVDAALFRLN